MRIVLGIVDELGIAREDQLLSQVRILREFGSQRPVHDGFAHVMPVCTQRQAGVSSQLNRPAGRWRTPNNLLEIEFRELLSLKIMVYGRPTPVIQLDRVIGRITKPAVRTRAVVPEKNSLHFLNVDQVIRDGVTLKPAAQSRKYLVPLPERERTAAASG